MRNANRRHGAVDHHGAGRAAGRRRRIERLRAARHRARGAGARAGVRASRGGFQGPPPFGPGGFPAARNARSSRSSTRTATSGSNQAERKAARELLAAEPARGFGRRGGPGGSVAAVAAWCPGSPGVEAVAGRRQVVSASAALYDTGTLRTIFLQFENADWEQELDAFHNTDVEVPATATSTARPTRTSACTSAARRRT